MRGGARFDPIELERVCEVNPVSEVLMRLGVNLKKRGREWVGLSPFKSERTPSFTVNDQKGMFHCLAGDTRVITAAGVRPIRELAGGVHRILTRGGLWVDAPFRSFGSQPVYEIIFTRNGVKKSVRATSGHRWFHQRKGAAGRGAEVLTTDLRPGMRMEASTPKRDGRTTISPFGVAHGFVFGDGTKVPGRRGCRAMLYHEKVADLLQFFGPARTWRSSSGDVVLIDGLPSAFKSIPSCDEHPSYLYGFVAGYIAADGCISVTGQVSISSSSLENLEGFRAVANLAGVCTHGVRRQENHGYKDGELFACTLVSSTIGEEAIIRSKHRERFESRARDVSKLAWTVESVSGPLHPEEVFCAEVEQYHSFALEDYILTGNCFASGTNGDVFDAVMLLKGVEFREAVEWLGGAQPVSDEERGRIVQRRREQDEAERAEAEKVRAKAKRVFDGASRIEGTHAAAYLEARGLIADPSWTFDLRFAHLPYFGFRSHEQDDPEKLGEFPVMLAAIRDARGELIGLHRTYLDPSEPKKLVLVDKKLNAAKKVYGEAGGGMIWLSEPGARLAVGEGIETVRSWFCLGIDAEDISIATSVSLGNLSGAPTGYIPHPNNKAQHIPNGAPDMDRPGIVLPPDVLEVTLIGDGDSDPATTRQHLVVAGRRFAAQGRSVAVSMAPAGKDFNDLLMGQQ